MLAACREASWDLDGSSRQDSLVQSKAVEAVTTLNAFVESPSHTIVMGGAPVVRFDRERTALSFIRATVARFAVA